MRGIVLELSSKEATDFLLPRHYAGRIPSISRAFGWKVDGALKAVCTFGKPATPFLCTGVCGKKYSASVYELNRLCRVDGFKEPLSAFVGACLRRLRAMNWIIISYSDTQMNHHGYIYQATNFLYTGMTKERTDMYTGGGVNRITDTMNTLSARITISGRLEVVSTDIFTSVPGIRG